MKKSDYAVPTTSGPMNKPVDMVSTGNIIINGVKGSAELPNATGVQAALVLFQTANNGLDVNNQAKASLRLQLAQVEANEVTLVRHWGLQRQGLLYAVNVYCDGSKEKVQSFNLSLVSRAKLPPATVPVDLHVVRSQKPTTPVVAWHLVTGNHGYLVQHATDMTNAATYATPVMCKRARFSLPGQTLGATLYFRVLTLDPSLPGGQSAYSAWVAVTVGAQ